MKDSYLVEQVIPYETYELFNLKKFVYFIRK